MRKDSAHLRRGSNIMYEGMDEHGKPIPKIRRASLLASQDTVPLQKSTIPLQTRRIVVRKRLLLMPSPHVPLQKRHLPKWIFLLVGVAFVLLLNSAWAVYSHQSLASIVLMQQLNQAQLKQQ